MDDGRRNALYRIMATTDWELHSNDSRTMSEGGRNKRGPGPSTWLYIASRGRVVLAFQKQRLGDRELLRRK